MRPPAADALEEAAMAEEFRIERDTMGEMRVPAKALYGPQTARAVENFPISKLRLPRAFIRALGLLKSAAAKVNRELGHLPAERAEAIERAAEQVSGGAHDDQFAARSEERRVGKECETWSEQGL